MSLFRYTLFIHKKVVITLKEDAWCVFILF